MASPGASDFRKRGAASSSPGPSLRRPQANKKPRRLGTRGAGFSALETDALLRLLRERLPLTKDEWEAVACAHVARFPGLERTADTLRRKLARLHRTPGKDMGLVSLPRDAQAAKAVLEAMARRAGSVADSGAIPALLGRSDGDESDGNADQVTDDGGARVDSMIEQVAAPVEPSEVMCQQCTRQLRPRTEYEDVMAMLRVSLLQMQQQREQDAADRRRREEEERVRREEQRQRREEEREADRERMSSLLAMVTQSHQTVEMLVLALVKRAGSDAS